MRRSFFGIYNLPHKLALLSSDLLAIALAFYISSNLRLKLSPEFLSTEYISLNLIILICLFLGNGYTSKILGSSPRLPLNTLLLVLSSAIPCTVFIYLLGPERFTDLFGRGVFPLAILLTGVFAVLSRLSVNRIMGDTSGPTRQTLIIGHDRTAVFVERMFKHTTHNISFTHLQELTSKERGTNFDAIVICPEHRPPEREQKLLLAERLSGTPIFSLSDFFEGFLFLIPISQIDNDWFIRSEGFTMLHSTVTIRLKRLTDITFSAVLLVSSLPVLLICALGIKLSSRGPIIFSQKRVGLEGKSFTIFKLRTMQTNAESKGIQWAQSSDDRAFAFGRFLRRSRLDELPQCWNILRGEMSFIGPRPERPEFTSMLAEKIPYYDLRHIVKPGLTGWAQVSYPYGASIEDSLRKLQYDLYYIKNYSMLLDLNIILRTVLVTLRRKGR